MCVIEASAMEVPILVAPSHGCVDSMQEGVSGCYYANFNNEKVKNQSSRHIKTSSLLSGELTEDDVIKVRKVSLLKSYGLF